MTNTIVRIHTDEGVEGVGATANYNSCDCDRYSAETIRHMLSFCARVWLPSWSFTARMRRPASTGLAA